MLGCLWQEIEFYAALAVVHKHWIMRSQVKKRKTCGKKGSKDKIDRPFQMTKEGREGLCNIHKTDVTGTIPEVFMVSWDHHL